MIYFTIGVISFIFLVFLFKNRTTTIKRPDQNFGPPSNNLSGKSIFKSIFQLTGAGKNIESKMEKMLLDSNGELRDDIGMSDEQLKSFLSSLNKLESLGLISPELARRVRNKWGPNESS